MKCGMRIKLARTEKNIKQKDLAERVGVSPFYLQRIESGVANNPTRKLMKKIACELDSSILDLFFPEGGDKDE